jgi:hypothetical protein
MIALPPQPELDEFKTLEADFRERLPSLPSRFAAVGAAHFTGAVRRDELAALEADAVALAFHRAPERIGPVRQRADVAEAGLAEAGAAIRRLARELRRALPGSPTRQGEGFLPNEVTIMRYRGTCAGISPHRDHARYRELVAIVSLTGAATLAVVADRAGQRRLRTWRCLPGDLVLLRAPGWAGVEDGRPLHLVEPEHGAERLSLSLRMSRPARIAQAVQGTG